MIYPLRARHRWMMPVVGILVFAGVLAALSVRQPMPTMVRVPGEAVVAMAEVPQKGLWGALPIDMSVMPQGGRWTATLYPRVALPFPDLLVYWVPNVNALDELPAQSQLLGTLSGTEVRSFVLPEQSGGLVLYSLAQGVVVGKTKMPGGDHE